MIPECAPSQFDPESLDPREALAQAEQFARSFDPDAAWTTSCRALEAAKQAADPVLRAEAELAVLRFAEQARAARESVERRSMLHQANELRRAGAIPPAREAAPPPHREPGLFERIADGIRGAFSAPRRAKPAP